MLLLNLAKSPKIELIFKIKGSQVEGLEEKDTLGQLMEMYVRGENKKWNENANFNFLSGFWGDISRVLLILEAGMLTLSFRRVERILLPPIQRQQIIILCSL
jgi:Domain of unknown function (DUF383)